MAKRKDISRAAKKVRSSNTDLAIEERLAGCGRGEADHIIYVGEIVERALKGELGAIIKALTAGRASRELTENRDGKLSSDRVLGRIEMCDILWNDLEQFVHDKDTALIPQKREEEAVVAYNYSPD